jgi:hypothetical protein
MKRVVILVLYGFVFSNVYSQDMLKRISDLSLPPVSTFKKFCSRCHGEEGEAYGKNFAKLREDSLRSVVKDMMFGPGGLRPDSSDITAMEEYNKSMGSKKPFAAVINSKSFMQGKDKELKIDASPDAKLEVDNDNVSVKENNGIWGLFYDPQKTGKVTITVKRNDASSSFTFPDEIMSN